MLKVLLEKDVDLNTEDYDARTALMIAARDGNIDIVKALLEKGADVNYKNDWDDTALSWAKGSNHKEIVHLLNLDYSRTCEN
jgi:ankyrin repeat protein